MVLRWFDMRDRLTTRWNTTLLQSCTTHADYATIRADIRLDFCCSRCNTCTSGVELCIPHLPDRCDPAELEVGFQTPSPSAHFFLFLPSPSSQHLRLPSMSSMRACQSQLFVCLFCMTGSDIKHLIVVRGDGHFRCA